MEFESAPTAPMEGMIPEREENLASMVEQDGAPMEVDRAPADEDCSSCSDKWSSKFTNCLGLTGGAESSSMLVIAVVVVLIIAIAYYFFVYRKKHPSATKTGGAAAPKSSFDPRQGDYSYGWK